MADDKHQLRIEQQRRYSTSDKGKAAQRARYRAKTLGAVKVAQPAEDSRELDDEALERAIYGRGQQLRELMRTPMCMWPADVVPDRPQPVKKERMCLGCTKPFMSDGPGNRLCLRCRKEKSFGWMYHG